jgi:ATP-dependent DNA ligase
LLAEACAGLSVPEVLFSEGVVGQGQACYAAALALGLEGIMAKHLASSYRPGRRSPTWRKIKPGRNRPGTGCQGSPAEH